MDFAALADAAAARAPQAPVDGVVPGRVLVIDGDGLAYYCAGNDDTSPGEARGLYEEKIRAAQRAAGVEHVLLAVTGPGSHKGHRYAVARAKPYQGQRTSSRRPKNWEFLRELLLADKRSYVVMDREADDVMAAYGAHPGEYGYGETVILTQDKDLRMVTGCWHQDWKTHSLLYVPKDTFELVHNDKVYGHKWFWLQMLQGDTADNIPGLPFYWDGRTHAAGPKKGEKVLLRVGEVTAAAHLAGCVSNQAAAAAVLALYRGYYGDRAEVEMLEQAVLLWMRTDWRASWDNCGLSMLGSLLGANEAADWRAAARQILDRIAESIVA